MTVWTHGQKNVFGLRFGLKCLRPKITELLAIIGAQCPRPFSTLTSMDPRTCACCRRQSCLVCPETHHTHAECHVAHSKITIIQDYNAQHIHASMPTKTLTRSCFIIPIYPDLCVPTNYRRTVRAVPTDVIRTDTAKNRPG